MTKISKEDGERYLREKRDEIADMVNSLKSKKLKLTINPMERQTAFKIITETGKTRFDFYVHVPLFTVYPFPISTGYTDPATGEEIKLTSLAPPERWGKPVESYGFSISSTIDEKYSPLMTAKKPDPAWADTPGYGPGYESIPEYGPINMVIHQYRLSKEEHETLLKAWYPKKPGAKKYLPDLDNPHPQVNPEGIQYFTDLLKRILAGVGFEVEIILYPPIAKETFAMPSHPAMFTLLALFAGKPERIPRKLLLKKPTERTPKEQKEAEEFLSSIIKTETGISYDEKGKEVREETQIAIVSDNPKVEARAEITGKLFSQDISFRETTLAYYIKQTFGAEGLRHLIGLIIGLEENFRQGYFDWTVNEHLKRLGYRKKQKGGYAPKIKRVATATVAIFTSLFITAVEKKGKKEKISGRRLFSIDGFDVESDILKNEIINESLILRATDFWYRHAFEPPGGVSPQYTKLLKKIAKENHRNHPWTIFITPLLAMYWRINGGKPMLLKATSLMEWCDLDTKGYKRTDNLKDLEGELNYMKSAGYLGAWENSGESPYPSGCKEPFECTLTFYPPEWLAQELELIAEKKERYLSAPKTGGDPPLLTVDELKRLFHNLGLSQNQFANQIGISRQMVNYLLNNKRKISQELSDKIREKFGYMLPV